MKKENYIVPEVTEVVLRTELGFAQSGGAENDPYDYEKLTW